MHMSIDHGGDERPCVNYNHNVPRNLMGWSLRCIEEEICGFLEEICGFLYEMVNEFLGI